MRLTEAAAHALLGDHDHGVLCTVHPHRGVDAVPVVYALDDDGHVGIPVDRIKPKASSRLQRERNLVADPRATLLIEHWDRADWSQLWWVRVRGDAEVLSDDDERRDVGLDALQHAHLQYRSQRPAGPVVWIETTEWKGWRAQADQPT